ncbi:hypothetical protein HHK36_009079 [Tetracentron sinense]|uniref:Uncharacterized protein n=1 Tax=Tetracentron sinense TaxID=13715 RepID=A0A834ZI63_TETSI|nr:hypothetical protein HHK36_009079 [Tetracentron sinense]
MSLSAHLNPFISFPQTHPKFSTLRPKKPTIYALPKLSYLSPIRSVSGSHESSTAPTEKPRWEKMVDTAASLYPFYVTVGGVVACVKPAAFSWFVKRGPASYSFSLGFIMLAMGLTLELRDLISLFIQRPFSILFGCVAQYTIMPTLGFIFSKSLGLSPSLSVGLILLACCPGGTASNVVRYATFCFCVPSFHLDKRPIIPLGHGDPFAFLCFRTTYIAEDAMVDVVRYSKFNSYAPTVGILPVTLIAQGDVPLSIVMTTCTTLGAVLLTPFLTKVLAGAYVPVDAVGLSISTLQVVVAPILLGSYIQSTFPAAVKFITPLSPLLAVLASSLLACSVFSENVVRLKSSMISASLSSDLSPLHRFQEILSGELGVIILSVLLLHFADNTIVYLSASVCDVCSQGSKRINNKTSQTLVYFNDHELH